MKDNRLTKILAIGAACVMAASAAIAQTTTSVDANVGPVGVGLTTSTGAFVVAPANDYFTFRTGTAEPVRYYYTPETTIVDPVGHTVTWTEIRPDMPATVHYVRQGDRMIVKRVVLAKPVTVKKETTTTTTTTQP
jgi:hypothetical protein